MPTENKRMKQRRDTAANWVSDNPILLDGEIGVETDTGQFKIGTGVDDWNTLDYFVPGTGTETTATMGALINSAAAKSTPVDADQIGLMDSAASNILKKLSWADLKAAIKAYYDSVIGTLTNKTISLGSNTISGTKAQFDTAVTDGNFVYQSDIGSSVQAFDSDLNTIAGLTAATDSFIQAKSGAWAARTIAQVKTDLGLAGTNSGDQTSIVGITGTLAQFNTAITDGDFADDTAVVHDTGDETVAGIKTFSSSPIVPTPTTDFQASTKKYVDDAIIAGGGYTDEQAQDAVGTILADTGDIDFTYDDATPAITGAVKNDSVTFAKMQNIATDRLVGRDTASAGDPEEITVGGGVEFTGSGGIQRSALTGDVTASAGSNTTSIAAAAVTYAKIQDVSAASRLLGRGSAGGAGDVEEIILGTNLSMSGTTLNATGSGGLTNVVEDTTPQLGGDLDANTFNIGFDDATGIEDDSGNEQLIFQKTTSAVNHIEVTNAATGAAPTISAAGDDANIDLLLSGKGTNGTVRIGGTGAGMIKLPEGTPAGAEAGYAVLSPTSTGNRLQLSNNNGAFSNVVTAASTDTLTNKTIDCDGTGNVITNVGSSEIKSEIITGLTEETSIAGGDFVTIYDASATALRKMTRTNFVAGLAGGSAPFYKNALDSSNIQPDTSGNVFYEPAHVKRTNDFFAEGVWVFNSPSADESLYGSFELPRASAGNAALKLIWTSTVTSGDSKWAFAYRVITGSDTNSLDQSSAVETTSTVTGTAPGAANRRMELTFTITDSNFATAGTVQWKLTRIDSGDTLAGAVMVSAINFSCD